MLKSSKWKQWKLHGNISRNGYGNAIIGRYGGYFEEGIWWVYGTRESCTVLVRLAMVEGESASIPWTHISHEELTFLLRKFLLVIETKHSTHTPRGRVGRYKPSRDPDRHTKDDNQ